MLPSEAFAPDQVGRLKLKALAYAEGLFKSQKKAILARVEAGQDPMEALRAAHEFEQSKLRELLEGQTEWAKTTREEIFERTWEALRPTAEPGANGA